MEFIPELKIGWLNGWLPLALFYVVFGGLMAIFPREVVRKLYDISGWSKQQRLLSLAGKTFALAFLGLMIFAPLKIEKNIALIGGVIYLLGFAIMIIALLNYRNAPEGQPATRGAYRFSRNPQWLGLASMFLGVGLATGAGLAIILLCMAATFYHFRLLGEERACLEQYGDSYQAYLESTSRYLKVF